MENCNGIKDSTGRLTVGRMLCKNIGKTVLKIYDVDTGD